MCKNYGKHFNVIGNVNFLTFLILNKRSVLIKAQITEHRTHLKFCTNSHMFRHQSAIIREFIKTKDLKFKHVHIRF